MQGIAILAAALFVGGSAAGTSPDGFGMACSGSETVQMGAGPARPVPYAISLSIDLAHRAYCYAACGRDQTYPIHAVAGPVITLADIDVPAQARHMILDRDAMRLTDVQRIGTGALAVRRDARATCSPSPFHPPQGG